MPIVHQFRGRRIEKTRRRNGWIGVRLAAVPQDDLPARCVRLTPEAYRFERARLDQSIVIQVVHPGGRR